MPDLFLEHRHISGERDYVGPFKTVTEAQKHRDMFGPTISYIVNSCVDDPRNHGIPMTPEEHIEHTQRMDPSRSAEWKEIAKRASKETINLDKSTSAILLQLCFEKVFELSQHLDQSVVSQVELNVQTHSNIESVASEIASISEEIAEISDVINQIVEELREVN